MWGPMDSTGHGPVKPTLGDLNPHPSASGLDFSEKITGWTRGKPKPFSTLSFEGIQVAGGIGPLQKPRWVEPGQVTQLLTCSVPL